jgi:hypothetical protein
MERDYALDPDEEGDLRDALEASAWAEYQTAESQYQEDARQRYSEALRRFSAYLMRDNPNPLWFPLGSVALGRDTEGL